jgi:hypothetical protein
MYDVPVLAGDTAIFFEGMDFDPTKVKREALLSAGLSDESTVSQEQTAQAMTQYYQNLAREK